MGRYKENEGFGLGDNWKAWGKARYQKEADGNQLCLQAGRKDEQQQPPKGQWMNWQNVEKRATLNRLTFIVEATYDVHPTMQNLSQWVGEDGSCNLCMGVASLKRILSGCKTSLTQGRYRWRHNKVLKCLLENERVKVNSLLVNDRDSNIYFAQEGWKSGHQACTNSTGQWD